MKKEVRKMHRRWIALFTVLILLISLNGCRFSWLTEENLPHQTTGPAETQQSTEGTPDTDPPVTEPDPTAKPTEGVTQPPETAPDTLPPVTDPPATEPPMTQPPATEPPATQPPPTRPPATEPPATKPPATEPPATTTPEEDLYDISGDTITELEQEIMNLINAKRVTAGVEKLEIDTRLCAITSVRAYEISILFEHTRPNGESCFTVLDDYGYTNYWTCGENILYCSVGFYDAADMVDMWMNSEGHRENMLRAEYTKMGLAVYEADGLYYAANLFVGT